MNIGKVFDSIFGHGDGLRSAPNIITADKFVVRTIKQNDTYGKDDFVTAKRAETDVLRLSRSWKKVKKKDAQNDAMITGGRFDTTLRSIAIRKRDPE